MKSVAKENIEIYAILNREMTGKTTPAANQAMNRFAELAADAEGRMKRTAAAESMLGFIRAMPESD